MIRYLKYAATEAIYRLRRSQEIRRRFPGLSLEPGVLIKGDLNNLHINGRVTIQAGSVIHLGGAAWCENKGLLEIGDGSVISPNCVLYASGPHGIRIGKNFDCGPGVGIFASRTDYERGPGHHVFAPVEIGDSVIIFANAVISPGVTIGYRSVVAANSVVTFHVPPNTLVGGVPARILKQLNS
jgi:acetyltransferase-like isoleucine patch superfamily enzyme